MRSKLQVQLQQIVRMVALRIALPIFILFWPLDIYYAPDQKWVLLKLRLLAAALCLILGLVMRRPLSSLAVTEAIIVVLFGAIASVTTAMGFVSAHGAVTSIYFQGLNLIALSVIPFLPLRIPALVAMVALLYLPFALGAGLALDSVADARAYATHLSLMAMSVVIGFALRSMTERLRERERQAELKLVRLAKQVAHDIRSPVAALKVVAHDLSDETDPRLRLIRASVKRIEDIAGDLLQKPQVTIRATQEISSYVGSHDVWPLVQDVLEEKRVEHRHLANVTIEAVAAAGEPAHTRLNPSDFKRAISNVMNNAVEAAAHKARGVVRVAFRAHPLHLQLTVEDNGDGIPAPLLLQLGNEGVTHGKEEGHGLGVSQARSAVRAWGGSLLFTTRPGDGTTVEVTLPRDVEYATAYDAVLIEDDVMVAEAWSYAVRKKKRLLVVTSLGEFLKQVPLPLSQVPIFIDQDLRDGERGTVVAQSLLSRGYTRLFLTTGYDRSDLDDVSIFEDVIGKEPPAWLTR